MDACTVLALLPFLCNEPEAPEPEEPVSEDLVIEAQPAPEIAAATLSAPRGPSSAPAEMQGPAAPQRAPENAYPEASPSPTPQPASLPRAPEPHRVAVAQEPDMAAAERLAAETNGEVVPVTTPSGASAVVLRPEDPDAAAVMIEPARVEHVQAREVLLEGPFDEPTDMEAMLERPRSARPRRDFDRGSWGQDDDRD